MAKKFKHSKYTKKLLRYPFKNNSCTYVQAVAGSGKSTSGVALSLSLHQRDIAPSHRQKLITFSRLSAKDLQKKISKEYEGIKRKTLPKATTIHSMAVEILRTYLKLKVTTLTDWQNSMVMRGVLEDYKVYKKLGITKAVNKNIIAKNVVEYIGKLKVNMMVSYDDLINEEIDYDSFNLNKPIPELEERALAKIVAMYEKQKRKDTLIDYNDMIFYTIQLLEKNPKALKAVRKDIDWLMQDESQDSSRMELALILLLVKNKRYTTVGDLSQTIYGWRDADSSLFSEAFLSKYFKRFKTFELPINYRSTPAIVAFGNKVREYRGDPLQAIPNKKPIPESVKLHRVENTNQETLLAVNLIKEHIAKGGSYGDVAVLTRGNQTISSAIEPILEAHKIPYTIPSRTIKKKLTERDLTIFYRLVLQLIQNGLVNIVIAEVLFFLEGWGEVAVKNYVEDVSKGRYEKIKNTKPKLYTTLISFLQEVENLHKKLKKDDLEFKDLSRAINHLTVEFVKDKLQSGKKREDMQKTLGSLYHYYHEEIGEKNLEKIIIDIIDDLDGNVEAEDNKDKVTLGTVHSQKGLSQKMTIAMGFTNWKEMEVNEEEICILYVQCSRAEEQLHLIYSEQYITKRGKAMQGYINPVLKNVLNLL